MEIKVKEMVSYGGHSLKANGNVDLTLKARYSECTNSIKLLQMLNDDIKLVTKIGASKPFKIGLFRLKEIKFDGDGESTIKLNSITDYVDADALNEMVTSDEFTVMYSANAEEEDEDGN